MLYILKIILEWPYLSTNVNQNITILSTSKNSRSPYSQIVAIRTFLGFFMVFSVGNSNLLFQTEIPIFFDFHRRKAIFFVVITIESILRHGKLADTTIGPKGQ